MPVGERQCAVPEAPSVSAAQHAPATTPAAPPATPRLSRRQCGHASILLYRGGLALTKQARSDSLSESAKRPPTVAHAGAPPPRAAEHHGSIAQCMRTARPRIAIMRSPVETWELLSPTLPRLNWINLRSCKSYCYSVLFSLFKYCTVPGYQIF